MVCTIGGERVLLWHAVDDEGEVLDLVVQKRRNTGAALKLLKRLLRNQAIEPETIVTDGLALRGSAVRVLGLKDRHRPGRIRENNRAENSRLPIRRRERKMLGFKSPPSAHRFLTTHAAIYNAFDFQRHMISRPTLRPFQARVGSVWAKAAA
jgi:putative transposase